MLATINPQIVTRLIKWWERILQLVEGDREVGNRVLQELFQAYSQRDRHYHNLNHIHQVLERVWEWRENALDLTSLQFAAWFHDVIYDPKASDNEVKSANVAAFYLAELGIEPIAIERVKSLILCTQFHQAPNDDIEAQILLDADLAILGADPATYQEYSHAIRREYSWLSEHDYRTGRRQVLINFLQRDRLYFTDAYSARLEKKARENIQAELLSLYKIKAIYKFIIGKSTHNWGRKKPAEFTSRFCHTLPSRAIQLKID